MPAVGVRRALARPAMRRFLPRFGRSITTAVSAMAVRGSMPFWGRRDVVPAEAGSKARAPARHPRHHGTAAAGRTTDSRHGLPIAPNLIERHLQPQARPRVLQGLRCQGSSAWNGINATRCLRLGTAAQSPTPASSATWKGAGSRIVSPRPPKPGSLLIPRSQSSPMIWRGRSQGPAARSTSRRPLASDGERQSGLPRRRPRIDAPDTYGSVRLRSMAILAVSKSGIPIKQIVPRQATAGSW